MPILPTSSIRTSRSPERNAAVLLGLAAALFAAALLSLRCGSQDYTLSQLLSALLGVNPNTVQKAYRLLEDEGLIRSHTGAKSCMVLDDDALARIRAALLAHEARRAVAALKQMGLTKDEALTLLETHWEEEEEE